MFGFWKAAEALDEVFAFPFFSSGLTLKQDHFSSDTTNKNINILC